MLLKTLHFPRAFPSSVNPSALLWFWLWYADVSVHYWAVQPESLHWDPFLHLLPFIVTPLCSRWFVAGFRTSSLLYLEHYRYYPHNLQSYYFILINIMPTLTPYDSCLRLHWIFAIRSSFLLYFHNCLGADVLIDCNTWLYKRQTYLT